MKMWILYPVVGMLLCAPLHAQIRVLRVFSEEETAGPLFQPAGVRVSESHAWVWDPRDHRIIRLSRSGSAQPLVLGRKGKGPGEFESAFSLMLVNGAAPWTYERSAGRVSIFQHSSTGDWQPVTTQARPHLAGLSLYQLYPLQIGFAAVFNASTSARNQASGEQGREGVLVRADSAGAVRDTILTFPLSGAVGLRRPRRDGYTFSVTTRFADARPHSSFSAACGGVIGITTGGRGFELTLLNLDGQVTGRVSSNRLGERTTQEQFAEYLGRIGAPEFRAHLERLGAPERHPVIHGMFISQAGHVWIRTTLAGSRDPEVVWEIRPLRRVGERLELGEATTLKVPATFRPSDAAGGELWGIDYDAEYGIPTVQVYQLPPALERPAEC